MRYCWRSLLTRQVAVQGSHQGAWLTVPPAHRRFLPDQEMALDATRYRVTLLWGPPLKPVGPRVGADHYEDPSELHVDYQLGSPLWRTCISPVPTCGRRACAVSGESAHILGIPRCRQVLSVGIVLQCACVWGRACCVCHDTQGSRTTTVAGAQPHRGICHPAGARRQGRFPPRGTRSRRAASRVPSDCSHCFQDRSDANRRTALPL